MKKYLFVFLLSAGISISGSALAEDNQKKDNTVAIMDEVVVSATKTEESRKEVTNSLIIIDEIDIQESTSESVGELLANNPGIDWRTRGDYGGASQEIRIRGMSGNATQVLMNGINVNSPSLGTSDLGRIPLNNIEKIEIIKGSGSLLYGSGAMGGTVNIMTKSPKKGETDFKASAGYGTNNTYRLSAEQGMFLSDKVGYYLTANRNETDGFRDNSDLKHNDVSLKLILDRNDELKFSLYGNYLDRKYGRPGVKPPEGTSDYYVGGTKFYNSESASLLDRGTDKDGRGAFQVEYQPSEIFKLNLKQDYSDTENYNYRRDPAAWAPKLAGEGEKTWVTNKAAVSEINLNITPNEKMGILFGGEYRGFDYERRNIDIDDNGDEKAGTETESNHHVFSKGSFIEVQYRPSPYFKALAGIRHEKHSSFGNENLPLFGAVINPTENIALKLNHGKHFKAPTMNDLYWPDDGWTRGNTDLQPEKGWHSDATIEHSLYDDKLFFTLTYFEWELKDKIAWAENPNFPTIFAGWNKWTPSNVDKFNGSGWEIGSKIGPFNDMLFSFDYTHMNAEEQKTGGPKRQAQYTPESQLKGSITYWTPFGLTLSTTARYVGERPASYTNNTVSVPVSTIDSYWTADLKMDHSINDSWQLSLQGNNIFDKEYDTYMENFTDQATATTTREGYPGAGRSFFLNLTYKL